MKASYYDEVCIRVTTMKYTSVMMEFSPICIIRRFA